MINRIYKLKISSILTVFLTTLFMLVTCYGENDLLLKEFVVFDPAQDTDVPEVLKTVAKEVSFPLSLEDKRDIKLLVDKFDITENCAGLAAPQIGISKRVIVFAIPDDPELKRRRTDLTDTMPKTVWVNPIYIELSDFGYNEDYEACFSVKDKVGVVKRCKKIYYEAYTIDGELVRGVAEGFLARVIQHEIDHLNGTLFIDKKEALIKLNSFGEHMNIKQQSHNGYQKAKNSAGNIQDEL